MILHLFLDGTAMITGHNARLISTVPQTNGILTLGDRHIRIEGEAMLDEPLDAGIAMASFTEDGGEEKKRYEIGTVSVRSGRALSANAESDAVIELMHRYDTLSEKYASLERMYKELSGKVEYNSIDFITDGGYEK